MTTDTYRQTRHCAKCGHVDRRDLSEIKAAFEESRAWKEPCPSCGSFSFKAGSCQMPNLSAQQLAIWGGNDDLYFLEQDEDLILAVPENIELLLQGFDSEAILTSKRKVLLSALLILIFDHHEHSRNKPEIVQQVLEGLRARRDRVTEVGTQHVPGYIRKRAGPLLADILNKWPG